MELVNNFSIAFKRAIDIPIKNIISDSFSVSAKINIQLKDTNVVFNSFSVCDRLIKVPLTFKNSIIQAFSVCIPSAETIYINKMRRGFIHRRR